LTAKNQGQPSGFKALNPAMRGAFMKGRAAFCAGIPIHECPYGDKRKPGGQISWSRAFRRAWQEGWHHEQNEQQKQEEAVAG